MGEEKDEAQMECPNCNVSVAIGTETCPECGTNLRTGETYEARVKRAKSEELHPEHFVGHVAFGITILFVLIVMGGFLYQRRVERVMRDREEDFDYFLRGVDEVEALLAQGKGSEARIKADQLIKELEEADAIIVIEDAPTTHQAADPYRRPKAERRAEKAQLKNLIKKLRYKLDHYKAQSRGG